MKKIIALLFLLALASNTFATIHIVAAENFYADVAQSIGGNAVTVYTVMNNPNQDPHLFSATPEVQKQIDKATIVIESGAGYDAWMDGLYNASSKKALLITVSHLMGKKTGNNPHIWYDPNTMPVFATALAQQLCHLDPLHKKAYENNLRAFLDKANDYQHTVLLAHNKVAGKTITATEPVMGYLATALGLHMLNEKFQWAIMNGSDLNPVEVAQFENSLDHKTVQLLVYNNQVTDPTTDRLKTLATKNSIPVVGVSETMPSQTHYYTWMNTELSAITAALENPTHD